MAFLNPTATPFQPPFPNPTATPFQPRDHEFELGCYYVCGRIPIVPDFVNDYNLSAILLDSGAAGNFVTDTLANTLRLVPWTCPPQDFTMANGQSMNVTSFVTFPLYIGGVQAFITAYVRPSRDGELHMILGMPGWDAFLIGIERTPWPVRETIATVAEERVEGEPQKRIFVPNVGNVAMQVSIVSVIQFPLAGLGPRDKGEELEARRNRKLIERAQHRLQLVQRDAREDEARAKRVVDEVNKAAGEMRNVAVEKELVTKRFLQSLEHAKDFVRDAFGSRSEVSDYREGSELFHTP